MSACVLASVQIFDLFKHVGECRGEKIEPMKLYRACHRRSGLGGLGGWPPSSLLLLLRWLPPPQNGCASFLKYLLFKPPKVFNKSHTRASSLFSSILMLPFFSESQIVATSAHLRMVMWTSGGHRQTNGNTILGRHKCKYRTF